MKVKNVPIPSQTRKRKRAARSKNTQATSYAKLPSVAPSLTAGAPTSLNARLVYCEKDVALDPGLGTPAVYTFALSGLFDPNFTGAGHQPARFDQYMAMYEQYVVYAASIRVSFQNTQTFGQPATIVGITISDQQVAPTTDCRIFVESGQTVHDILAPRQDSEGCKQLAVYTDIAKSQGVSRAMLLTDNGYKGNDLTNPSDGVYAHIWAQSITSSDIQPVNIFVEIQYYAQFQGSKLTALS